jgi:hypothetical protein
MNGGQQRPAARVIYIMGSGHSGSTILGVALGNCTGMFFAGELEKFLTRAGTPVLGGLERTRFWARVREQLPQADELYGNRAHRLLERSSAVLRVRTLPRRRALRAPYRRFSGALFAAIAATAQADYVIDSSHFPLRAGELQQVPGLELHLLFLVRDPQAVVSSINRLLDDRSGGRRMLMTLKANADLWLTHALSLLVFARQNAHRRTFVRYEDFIARPEAVLEEILRRSGSPAAVPDLEQLRTGLAIHANRLISSEVVALKRADADTPRSSSTLTRLLQWPFSRAFARLSAQAPGADP